MSRNSVCVPPTKGRGLGRGTSTQEPCPALSRLRLISAFSKLVARIAPRRVPSEIGMPPWYSEKYSVWFRLICLGRPLWLKRISIHTRPARAARIRKAVFSTFAKRPPRDGFGYFKTLMRNGVSGRSTTNSGCSRRKVSAMWQFQQTGQWALSTSWNFSAGISFHWTVLRSLSSKAGG